MLLLLPLLLLLLLLLHWMAEVLPANWSTSLARVHDAC
jgi:hypothetical protein